MLDNALDLGISEREFWDMTIGELDRLAASKERTEKLRLQEKATFDYILATLIGRAIAGGEEYPSIHDVYSSIFDSPEKQKEKEEQQQKLQEKKEQLSALRFKQFAQSYNKRFKEMANSK